MRQRSQMFLSATAFATAVIVSCSAAAALSLHDAPYTETVSFRNIFASSLGPSDGGLGSNGRATMPLPTGWGVLPYNYVFQAVSTKLGGVDGVVSVTDGGIYWNLTTLLYSSPLQSEGHHAVTSEAADYSAVRLFADHSGGIVAAANGSVIIPLRCNTTTCTPSAPAMGTNGGYQLADVPPTAVLSYPGNGTSTYILWLSTVAGTNVCSLSTASNVCTPLLAGLPTCTALAHSKLLGLVACGSSTNMILYDSVSLEVVRTDWVTDIINGNGAVYDDVITSLAFDDCDGGPTNSNTAGTSSLRGNSEEATSLTGGTSTLQAAGECGSLYVGNPTALNIRYPNGSVVRFAGEDGLPYNNITSITIDRRSGEWWRPSTGALRRVWIGTTAGLILFDPLASPAPGTDVFIDANTGWPVLQQRWRYFNGPRWLSVAPTNLSFVGITPSGLASVGNDTYVATAGGVTHIQSQSWTLAAKADWYENEVLPRHDRSGLGLVADCTLDAFGNVSSCFNSPCESNGLWTGIQLAAEVLRFAVTGSEESKAAALHYGFGMQLLINATGNPGFPARTVSAPWEPVPTGSSWWHNCTAPGFTGWLYMGNTSSDSVTGHAYAYGMFSAFAPSLLGPSSANLVNTTQLLSDITTNIVTHNFTLMDPTGVPTRWGVWTPQVLNLDRTWSDGRGVNSMQILSYLLAASASVEQGSNEEALFSTAMQTLLSRQNDYAGNLVNAKIEAPTDDNFSDDELLFLPYGLACAFPSAFNSFSNSTLNSSFATSLHRSFQFVRNYRPALWSLIYLSCTNSGAGPGGAPDNADGAVLDSWWNLVTWPLELVDWPMFNSQRLDIVLNPEPNRNYQYNTESRVVLPANERGQYRWNSDPYELDSGGQGMDEYEPGAWLLPYWMARQLGILK